MNARLAKGVVVGLALTIAACSSKGTEGSGGAGGNGTAGASTTTSTTTDPTGTTTGSTTGTTTSSTTGTTTTTGTTSGTTTTTPTSTSTDPHQICVDSVNALRATIGFPPLARWIEVEPCVDQQATQDQQNNTPHGAWNSGQFACNGHAQNECHGYSTAQIGKCASDMWNEKNAPGCAGCDDCFDKCTTQCPSCDFFGQTTGKVCGHYVNMGTMCHTKVACGFSPVGGWIAMNFQ